MSGESPLKVTVAGGSIGGLCAGIAAMASVFFAMLAYLHGQTLVTTASTVPPEIHPERRLQVNDGRLEEAA